MSDYGVLRYRGKIVDKSEIKNVKGGYTVMDFSFATPKKRKEGYENIVFDGQGMRLSMWGQKISIIDTIPVGQLCEIELMHDIKDGNHIFKVRSITPLDAKMMNDIRNAGKPDAPKPKPEPEPEPDPPSDLDMGDDDLPF